MPNVQCNRCEAVFFAAKSRYYWCDCGEPLTDGDEIREQPPPVDRRRAERRRTDRFRPASQPVSVEEAS